MIDRMTTRPSAIRSAAIAAAVLALSACGGGGGGAVSAPAAPTSAPTTAGYVTPQFTIVIPAQTPASVRGRRAPQFISGATASITITITNPPAGLTPTSVTTNISAGSCNSGCTVSGPPSPPGQLDNYTLVTYDGSNGTGNALDTGTVSLTPVAGQANSASVTLKGIPATIVISGVPNNFAAGTAGQSAALTVVVTDADGRPITGTYASPVTINAPDPNSLGVTLTGTNPGCAGHCATLNGSADSVSLLYGGVAENPITLTSAATGVTGANAGSAVFTPVLQPIVWFSGPTSVSAGSPKGVDLFTNDNTSPIGYTGTEVYAENGFTNPPYSMALSVTGAAGCATFATVTTGADTANGTPFTATSIASPVAGICTLTVTDNLTDQPNALPTFVVTYTTSSLGANGKHRR